MPQAIDIRFIQNVSTLMDTHQAMNLLRPRRRENVQTKRNPPYRREMILSMPMQTFHSMMLLSMNYYDSI